MNYKKSIVFVSCVLLVGIVLLLVFQSNDSPSEPTPPDLQVRAGAEVITAMQGSYCWKEKGEAVCVDYADPSENLSEEKGLQAVSSGSVKLDFNSPPETIEVERKSEEGWEKQQINDLQLELPEPKDNYIYRVSGQWKQGDVSYAFLVRAK